MTSRPSAHPARTIFSTLACALGALSCTSEPTTAVVPRYEGKAFSAVTGGIAVRVTGIPNATGQVIIALYDRATWMDEGKVLAHGVGSVHGAEVLVPLEHVPAGRYAIAVLDDENGDGKMNWGLTGPSEPYGFSRGARGTFGPPSFDDAAFDFDGGALSVEVAVK